MVVEEEHLDQLFNQDVPGLWKSLINGALHQMVGQLLRAFARVCPHHDGLGELSGELDGGFIFLLSAHVGMGNASVGACLVLGSCCTFEGVMDLPCAMVPSMSKPVSWSRSR